MKVSGFTASEIRAMKEGTFVKIKDSSHADVVFKKGGKLVFQNSKHVDNDEYSFGISTEVGCTFEFPSFAYELIDEIIPLDEVELELAKKRFSDPQWDKAEKEEDAKQIIKWFCEDYNLTFTEVQHYQVRVSKEGLRLDIYPQSKKFHSISSNGRGHYQDLTKFLCDFFNIPMR